MPVHPFARSLVFAGFAALVMPVGFGLLAPVLGGAQAVGLIFVALAGVYGFGMLRPHSLRAGAVLAAATSLAVPFLSSHPAHHGAVAAGAVLLVCHLGIRPIRHALRRFVTELTIAAASIAWVYGFLALGLTSLAIVAWGFFLIQSARHLIRGWIEAGGERRGVDPFDRAQARLLVLLDEGG